MSKSNEFKEWYAARINHDFPLKHAHAAILELESNLEECHTMLVAFWRNTGSKGAQSQANKVGKLLGKEEV